MRRDASYKIRCCAVTYLVVFVFNGGSAGQIGGIEVGAGEQAVLDVVLVGVNAC